MKTAIELLKAINIKDNDKCLTKTFLILSPKEQVILKKYPAPSEVFEKPLDSTSEVRNASGHYSKQE